MSRSNTRVERAARAFAIQFGMMVVQHPRMRRGYRHLPNRVAIGPQSCEAFDYSGAFVTAKVWLKAKQRVGMHLIFELTGSKGSWTGGTCRALLPGMAGSMIFTAETNGKGELVVSFVSDTTS